MAISKAAAEKIATILIEEIGHDKAHKLLDRLEREITTTESYKTTLARISMSVYSSKAHPKVN